jgi:Cu/Ag efflux protein CusF
MHIRQRITRITALSAALFTLGACANAGGLGSILGSVLGGVTGSGQQLAGTVRGVDTRNSQISIQQSDGQSVAVLYDLNTKVVYQNRLYAVTNLEIGDQINARIQTTQNNSYYTDSIAVTQPVNGSTGTGSTSETVQQLQGTVRSIDRTNGKFTVDAGSNVYMTVSMPYRANSTDANKFNNLRIGDYVRFSGVYLNNSLVELRQFY